MTGSSERLRGVGGPLIHIPTPRHDWPSVGVVIVTRDRPNLVRRALASVMVQDYRGSLRTVIVFDQAAPDWSLTTGGERPVLVLENWRTPGRAGARNTGILAVGDCDLVAICDDHDVWSPAKLTAQVSALHRSPGAVLSTCGHEVEYGGTCSARLAGRERVDIRQLCAGSRRQLRGSGVVAVQRVIAADAAHGGVGLLCETAPLEGEEWELLVRAAKRAPIAHVDVPLIRVLWRRADLGATACAGRAQAMQWVLARHPELGRDRSSWARIAGEIACWYAGAGDRVGARRWARAARKARWWGPDGVLATVAAAGILRGRALRAALRRTVER